MPAAPKRAAPIHRTCLAQLGLVVALGMLVAPGAASDASDAPDGWGQGVGTWGGDGDRHAANATWLVFEGEVVAYHIETENGIRATCSQQNGTLVHPDGTGLSGRCGGGLLPDVIQLHLRTQNHDEPGAPDGPFYNGTFQPTTGTAAPPSPADSSPLTALLLLATVALAATTGTVLVLLVRERRLTGHLARRLWETRRTKTGSKRPESLQAENVRRILVRSKN